MKKLFVALFILNIVYSLNSFASPETLPDMVHEKVLKNGLKVLVKEDRRAPVMVSQIWYKVGASYEHDGITGVSHVLEHMMFQGTENLEPGEFSKIIAENGGRENAFTGADYTAYFQTMEASRLEVSLRLEAERMQNLKLQEKEFSKELQVVMEERRMRTEDKPRGQAYEYFKALAYTSSPYRNPIIGWMQDLKDMELEDLAVWYKQWYSPNNATLVVVGDVQHEQVFQLAEQYFEPIPAVAFKPIKKRTEVPQVGVRRSIVKQNAKVPYLLMGYKVPVLNTVQNEEDVYALEVLSGILSGGSSARLPSNLVRGSQVASSASAGYDMNARLPTLFLFDGAPAADKSIQQLEEALVEQIANLQTDLIEEKELNRVKAQVIAASVYEKDSNFYQAMQLGMLETVGVGWQKAHDYVEKVNAVTAEQVRAVAQQYLIEDHLTVVHMLPMGDANEN
ncbi:MULTISPECIES: M16 family metallopeptidase [Cycloclasticus]|uniref:M16 family metallopeptidase n=1 Tax=Cycloclasticus TaxID=34067 RepID=UPI000286A97D|nr:MULTISPECIES: pitrilysin family protein [Cycloclasticus]AFT67841.1 Peptidase M16-like protein [Cycloclasticus sp. P1]MDF1829013.1 pitrilysin family protein [Cycloclasticus pugetii]